MRGSSGSGTAGGFLVGHPPAGRMKPNAKGAFSIGHPNTRGGYRVSTEEPPNPGSDAARKRGCICAVIDNNRGRSAPFPPNGWSITDGCPVHTIGGRVMGDPAATTDTPIRPHNRPTR